MSRYVRIASVPLLILLIAGSTTRAGWSDDPAQNLAVADRVQDQVQPKVAATSDGGCFISWFDNAASGYDVYLQRLDAKGDELWAHNGILQLDAELRARRGHRRQRPARVSRRS